MVVLSPPAVSVVATNPVLDTSRVQVATEVLVKAVTVVTVTAPAVVAVATTVEVAVVETTLDTVTTTTPVVVVVLAMQVLACRVQLSTKEVAPETVSSQLLTLLQHL
jgi:hypothetical protein